MRVPFLQGGRPDASASRAAVKSNTDSARLTKSGSKADLGHDHVKIFLAAQEQWRGFDVYARVCLAFGLYHILQVLCYFALSYFSHDQRQRVGGFFCIVTFLTIIISSMRLHFIIKYWECFVAVTLLLSGPVLAGSCLWAGESSWRAAPAVYILHLTWLLFLLYEIGAWDFSTPFPRKFRDVALLDIPSWLKSSTADGARDSNVTTQVHKADATDDVLKNRLKDWLALWNSESLRKEHLSAEQAEQVQNMQFRFKTLLDEERKRHSGTQDEGIQQPEAAIFGKITLSDDSEGLLTEGDRPDGGWVCLFYDGARGQVIPYWHHVFKSETVWERPSEVREEPSNFIALTMLFQEYTSTVQARRAARAAAAVRENLEREESGFLPGMPSKAEIASVATLPFDLFRQGSTVLLLVWCIGAVGIAIQQAKPEPVADDTYYYYGLSREELAATNFSMGGRGSGGG
eukprot:gnl/MRDRNA2_/MRDRNA2_35349_c0_seq1.p1 gnl/MRDRNA2_/MRDRNA2_35349_c0~~gnl/MRDRNA2_/MRDRNA2_35349_c0_seq1.p1  ORF type:complete len:516 (+),score=101.94 gnl/MRDRNA2_/MRDRNA2_35349_c0_seq1:172-1548(+)